jgi:hypothetical protein
MVHGPNESVNDPAFPELVKTAFTVTGQGTGHPHGFDAVTVTAPSPMRVTVTVTHGSGRRTGLVLDQRGCASFHGRLVQVPLPVIVTVPDTVTGRVMGTVTDTVTPTVDPLVPELRSQIGHLEDRLKATQDEFVGMAQKVGAAETELVALRARVMEIRADRDAWRQQAERLARPWWRRLAG